MYTDMASYHTQQAVEKLLKFMIVQKGAKAPYSHDIMGLINLCNDTYVYKLVYPIADTLTRWEASVRYSGNIMGMRKATEDSLKIAKLILEHIIGTGVKQTSEFE